MLFRLLVLAVTAVQLFAQNGYRDADELNLARAIQVQPDASKRLALLDRWEQRYPRSAHRQERFHFKMLALQSLGRGPEMWTTALRMFQENRSGESAYWVSTLAVAMRQTAPGALSQTEAAARSLVELNDPSETAGHRALGWVALCRRQWSEAATQFKIVLLRDASDAEASYWMAVSLAAQPGAVSRDVILFYLARAVVVTGPNALPPEAHARVRTYLEQRWMESHGSQAGLDTLYSRARKGPLAAL